MVLNNKYGYIFRTSKDDYYKFTLDGNKNLLIDSNDNKQSFIYKQNILDYSMDIDKADKIHILYMNLLGQLRYDTYPNSDTEKLLTTTNLNNFNIKFLNIKLIQSDIHIFYMLNAKHTPYYWAIYHTYAHNNQWNSIKVADIISEKYLRPYTIDIDNDNIYLFYSKNDGSTYNIKEFNLNQYQWFPKEDMVSTNISHTTSFFINNKANVLACYSASINKTIQIFIKYKNLYEENSSWSKEIQISSENTNATHPSIISKDNHTYIMWEEGNNIVYRKSVNGAENWEEKKVLVAKDNKFINSIYISNNVNDKAFKSFLTLMSTGDQSYPIINLENQPERYNNSSSSLNEKQFPAPKSSYIYPSKPSVVDFTKELQELLQIKSKTVYELERVNAKLEEDLNNLMMNHEENANKLSSIKSELMMKNDILDEKNKIIENLNRILSSLYEENANKAKELEYLKEKLNKKTFFNLFKYKEPE